MKSSSCNATAVALVGVIEFYLKALTAVKSDPLVHNDSYFGISYLVKSQTFFIEANPFVLPCSCFVRNSLRGDWSNSNSRGLMSPSPLLVGARAVNWIQLLGKQSSSGVKCAFAYRSLLIDLKSIKQTPFMLVLVIGNPLKRNRIVKAKSVGLLCRNCTHLTY